MAEDEGWFPKSKEDWAEVFSMGLARDREEQAKIQAEKSAAEEAEAERLAKEKAENPPPPENPPAPKPVSFGDRLLGVKPKADA